MQKYHVESILDIPCGDMTWMDFDQLGSSLKAYIGADISAAVIERNTKLFAVETRHSDARKAGTRKSMVQASFILADAVEDNFRNLSQHNWPAGTRIDMIFCRHMMIHMTPGNVN